MHLKLPLIFEPQPEGGFTVTSPLLPELITEGDSVEDALENVRDALAAVIEIYQETGRGWSSIWAAQRATSAGSMAPASQTSALATAQAIAWRSSGSGSSRSSQPSTSPASSESPEPTGLTALIPGGMARYRRPRNSIET